MKGLSNANDISGQKFNMLTAVEYVGRRNKGNHPYWLCRCECGNEKVVSLPNLKSGAVKSCGCLPRIKNSARMKEQNKTHGKSKTRLYNIYHQMKTRCYNPAHPFFYRYGGRGISICNEWQEFEVFYAWAINNGYEDGLTIDRINNDGVYSPDNCRWVKMVDQTRNRGTNHHVTVGGETHCLSEWAEINDISYNTIMSRLRYGWDEERAVTVQPLIKHERKNVS